MKALSEIIFKGLKAANIKHIGTKIFPVIANRGADFPFLIFLIEKRPVESKDKAAVFEVQFSAYHKDYTEILNIYEELYSALMQLSHDSKEYRFRDAGAKIAYIREDEVFVLQMGMKILK